MDTIPVIKPIYNEYGSQIVDLVLPIQQIEFNVPITLEDQPDMMDVVKYYHQTGGGFWGALHNEELVGTIALISIGHNSGALRKMFVKKEFRGRETGIAQRLLEGLIAYSRENQINDLYLGTVSLLKAACRFYERNGFVKIEAADLPAYFPLMKADNVFYHLHLDSTN